MKNYLIALLLTVSTACAYGQKESDSKVLLPMKDGAVFFEKVVDLPNADKDVVFNASLKWLASAFVDSKEVIQLKDKESGAIVGKGILTFVPKGFLADQRNVNFMVDISCKDNKSRIRLFKFQNRTSIGETYPFEDSYNSYLKELEYPRVDKRIYLAFNERVEEFINGYQVYMKSNSVKDDF